MTIAQKQNSFADRTAARVKKENSWQNYSAEAVFYAGNMVKSLEELATATFPNDNFNSNAYQEAIARSLTETISPEVGIKDFWDAMADAECAILRIIDGHLNFFNSENDQIDITSYTQPIVFEAHSSFYKQRQLEREARIQEAKAQLSELIKEIHRK